MTTATGTSRRLLPAPGLGRIAAVLAIVSAGVHLMLLDASSLGSLAMLGMALVCLPCAWHLWRSPTPGVWGTTAALDVGMLLVHAQMLAGTPSMPGMAHGGESSLVVVGLAVVATQLVLAATAGLLRLRSAVTN
jgi:hypothetical protein